MKANPEDQAKFVKLLDMAETAEEDGHRLQHASNDAYTQAADYEAQAAEMLVRFRRGDVIEYEQPEGYGERRKMVKRSMLVKRMEINRTYEGVTVTGQAYTRKVEPSHNSASVVFGNKAPARFLRIVREGVKR